MGSSRSAVENSSWRNVGNEDIGIVRYPRPYLGSRSHIRDRKCPGAERHRGRPPNLQSTQLDPRIYEEMRIGDDFSVGLDL